MTTEERSGAQPTVSEESGRRSTLLAAGALLLLLVLVNAWLCDDAFISFRSARNLVEGRGLRWNVDERVQVFTNPLWVLLVAASMRLGAHVFVAAWGLSLACTALTAWLLVRFVEKRTWPAMGCLLGLCASTAFVDYSTSGLENPLAHALLAAQLAALAGPKPGRGQVFVSSLLLALGAVNRLDSVLLAVPLWGQAVYAAHRSLPAQSRSGGRTRWRWGRTWFLPTLGGLLPLLLWEGFALAYFGFALPNTAYAKLGTGIPVKELALQGLLYLGSLAAFDGAGALLLVAGLTVGLGACLSRRGRDPLTTALVLGVLLQVAYLVQVGGDFMAGRMLSSCVLAGAVLLARCLPVTAPLPLGGAGLLLAWALVQPASPFHPLRKPEVGMLPSGIGDERAQYLDDTSLLRLTKDRLLAQVLPLTHSWAQDGARASRQCGVVVVDHVGFYGYNAGPCVHVVDPLALTDPLLSRLPALEVETWRIGHFERVIPEGYERAALGDTSAFADRPLAQFYERLRRVTAGPLWTKERWRDIWAFSRGELRPLIDAERYRHPPTPPPP